MMTKLIKSVRPVIAQELTEANKNFPLFHSSHEAYATLKEETEETSDESKNLEDILAYFWLQVKADDPDNEKLVTLMDLKQTATLCACEAIQAAAMAQKAIDSMGDSKDIAETLDRR